jgi:hypothetical protein
VLELLGKDYPAVHDGHQTRPPDGLSFAGTFDDPGHATGRSRQYYELEGNRGYRLGDWKAVSLQAPGQPIDLDRWMLFNLKADPTECEDLAGSDKARLAELIAEFESDAASNQVYPLDNRDIRRALAIPPYLDRSLNEPRDFWPGTGTYPAALVSHLLSDRDFEIACEFRSETGSVGVLFAIGDNLCGIAAGIDKGRLYVVYRGSLTETKEASADLAPGEHRLTLRHRAAGWRRGSGVIMIDNDEVAELDMSPTFLHLIGEGLDVGKDRGLQVFASGHLPSFTGTVLRVSICPGTLAPGSPANRLEAQSQAD